MRLIKAVTALLLVVCALAAPAFAEVAVVDVARVIDASAPGKAGQKYVDNLKASLEAELERFVKKTAKDKDAQAKAAQAKAANKQAELNAQFAAEYDRVTARVMDELRKVVAQWIKTNKKGITVVVPAHTALGYAPAADVSGEILKKLNAVAIDFTAK
ncbi:OmpH family outer membrane protein [uncultured Cloacibacillus sp.]|uniref:OmpH family outer membrane protein n=1 Tax=uncultured Cloacibacillus sp. TaxID=889794 RepID=UPI0032093A5C